LALRLGRVYRELGNNERAAALAEHALKTDKDPERCAEFERWATLPAAPADGN
jgi:hypothetical protein